MKLIARIFLIIILATPLGSSAQIEAICGYWHGKFPVGNDSLTLVLVIEQNTDTIRVVLDSPDQYITDIQVDSYQFQNDTLRFRVKSLGVDYVGQLTNEEIKGRFTQYGRKRKLTLTRTEMRKTFPRPQEPHAPYPYQEIALSFPYQTELPPITGTLTLPNIPRPHCLIILLSGSGRQDRDEAICGHRPFKVIADHLTRAGFAVFRYDDPPYSTFIKQNTIDFARQAQVVFDTLANNHATKGLPIGLLGHSEGGMTAWIVAAQNSQVAFVISLAGMGTPIRDILLYQTHAIGKSSNLSDAQLVSNQHLNSSLYAIMEKSKTPKIAQKRLQTFFKKYTRNMSSEQRQTAHCTEIEIAAMQSQLLSNWMFTLFHLRPSDYLCRVVCPVLALNGSLDLQVSAFENLAAIQNGLRKSNSVTCLELDGLNHLFQECSTGSPQEYGELSQTISPTVLKNIEEWLRKNFVLEQ